jgi:type I restriction enzyme S subunit
MTKAYPAYKDSGVEWLGEVPDGWEVSPLKHVADFINGSAFKPETWSEVGTPIIRIENLNGGNDFNCYDGEVNERYIVNQGDILFGWSGNRGTSFGPFIWGTPGRFYLNQHIFNVQGYSCDRLWFYWCLRAVTEYVEQQAHGIIGMVHVTKGNLGAVNIPLPTPPEQTAIAAFLNRETAKIDALVAEQRWLIDLLREKRQAVISHAVTKGLNAKADLKPSGIDSLGDVPAHWTAPLSLKRVADRVVVGIAEAAAYAYVEVGVPILRSMNVRAGKLVGDLLYLDPAYSTDRDSKMLHAGDLITVRTGHAGVTAVIPKELDGCQCFTMLVTTLKAEMHPQYFCYWMNSLYANYYFGLEAWGSAQPNISVPILQDIPVYAPPFDEQVAIAAFLDEATAKLDTLTATAETAITLLQERRAALISAAATGKIDVRPLSPQATEAA